MSPSVGTCCIKGCTEKSRLKRQVDLPVKFYCFPSSKCGALWKLDRRLKWINAVKNYVKNPKEWEPNQHTRICSAHFINNRKSDTECHPSYVPSIFPGREKTRNSIQRLQRFERSRTRQLKKEINVTEPILIDSINSSVNSDNSTEDEINNSSSRIDMNQDAGGTVPAAQDDYHRNVNITNVSLPAYYSIACQTEEFIPDVSTHNCEYFLCNMINHDGISTAEVQANISAKKTAHKMCKASIPSRKSNVQDSSCDAIDFESLQSHCKGFHGFSSITNDETMSSLTGVTLCTFSWLLDKLPECESSEIDNKTKLLITLVKLRTGLTFTAISVLFNIHQSTVNRIFVKTLRQLNILLKNFIFWPSKAAVQATLPKSFKQHYPNTRVIIDCTEVDTEAPPAVEHRVSLYSEYRHHYTMKFLVGCTPSGFISFLSNCYSGRSGDCFIINDCGIVELIESGDVVLANEDFLQIQTTFQKKKAIFVTPPICNKNQSTSEEDDETHDIAPMRRHIEQLNQRIRNFKILSKVPVSLLPHVDDIVFVICAIINIQKPFFKNEKSVSE